MTLRLFSFVGVIVVLLLAFVLLHFVVLWDYHYVSMLLFWGKGKEVSLFPLVLEINSLN